MNILLVIIKQNSCELGEFTLLSTTIEIVYDNRMYMDSKICIDKFIYLSSIFNKSLSCLIPDLFFTENNVYIHIYIS